MMKKNTLSWRGLTVWLICALFFMYEFLLRTVLGTFQYPLMTDLQISPVKFAILSSTAYQIIYSLMQLPVGIIVDRLGLKKTLLFAVVLCGIANLGFALTHQFELALLLRILMGLGSSFGFICLLVAVYNWMPYRRIAFFIGLSQFIGTLGPMLAAGPLNALTQSGWLDWRRLFMVLAGIAAVIAMMVFFWVDNNRERRGRFLVLSKPSSLKESLPRLIRQKQVWFIGLFSSCVYFSIEYLSENEGVTFLIAKGFSAHFSSYLLTIAWLGYALGCPILGYVSDRVGQRKPILLFSAMLVLVSLPAIIFLPLHETLMSFYFFLLGFGAGGQSLGFAIVAEYCKESYLAVGLAFNNAMIMFFAALNAPLMGWMLSRSQPVHGLHSLADYQKAFMIMLVFVVVGLLWSTWVIRETYCKSMRENTILRPLA